MIHDVRYALRTVARRPSFAIAAVTILALGIAVNTIAFSLLNSLALRPLPVPDAGRVVRVYPLDERGRRGNLFSYADVVDYRAQASDVFETLAAYLPAEITAGRSSLDRGVVAPRAALAYVVSSSYFDVTRVRPALGRILQPPDDGPGVRVAVLSDAYWQRRFNGDGAVIGATIWLNAEPFTIVGVAAPGFAGTEPLVTDIWMPVSALRVAEPRADFANRNDASFLTLGRLRPGAGAARANLALDVIAERLAAAYPGPSRPRRTTVAPGTFFPLEPGLKPVIAGALAVVGLVLLIACGNVANLTLARAISRQKEIAVRLAIGASRSRIVRQLVVEALLLSLTAGAIGLLLSTWALRLLYVKGLSLNPFWWTVSLTLAPDARVFAYTLAIATIAGLVFGLAPALQLASPVVSGLNDSRTVAGTRVGGAPLRHGLVVLQIAGSLVLLMAAGLLARGLQSAEALNVGFNTRDVVYAEYSLRAQGYSVARAAAFNAALLERLAALDGVAGAALTSHVPLHGGVRRIDIRLADASTAEPVNVTVTTVSPGYFDVLGIGFIAGRGFDSVESGVQPVVISEGLARRFWPGQPAIGKTMTSDGWAAPRTIIGVVRDAATAAIWREKELAVYVPPGAADPRDVTAALVRTSDSSRVRAALESTAASLDPDLRFAVLPLDALLQFWLLPSRVAAAAAGVLALIAIALASFGLYAVLSFTVTHRLREIGIRMAIGATSRDIVSLVTMDAWRLMGVGFAVGGVCAAATAPLLGRLLFGVSAFDPVTIAGVIAVLAGVALAASYAPARRASRLEPLDVLRME
jgi:putative ABC transport system permease protein